MSEQVKVKVTDETQGFLSEFGALPAEKEVTDFGTNYKVSSPSGDVIVLKESQVEEV